MIRIKRVYEEADKSDGLRVLVDRLWPRGVSKAKAKIDLWLKDVSPSAELRTWFGHDPEKWPEFCRRYRQELGVHGAELEFLRAKAKQGTLTLLFGSKEPRLNNAAALKEYLEKR